MQDLRFRVGEGFRGCCLNGALPALGGAGRCHRQNVREPYPHGGVRRKLRTNTGRNVGA